MPGCLRRLAERRGPRNFARGRLFDSAFPFAGEWKDSAQDDTGRVAAAGQGLRDDIRQVIHKRAVIATTESCK